MFEVVEEVAMWKNRIKIWILHFAFFQTVSNEKILSWPFDDKPKVLIWLHISLIKSAKTKEPLGTLGTKNEAGSLKEK